MKRIGILTQYHNTTNYGGALQAYALCKVLNTMGYDCEQIDVDFTGKFIDLERNCSRLSWVPKPIKCLYRWLIQLKNRKYIYEQKYLEELWKKAFHEFTHNSIAHSNQQYDENSIFEANSKYDIFVVGSDQIWNPIWYYEPFFLTFVSEGKKKIAYAASIAQKGLSENVKKIYSSLLKTFDAISVRESNAVSLLSDIVKTNVEYVLDPTLLIEREHWDSIAAEKLIDSSYVICYFLGNNECMRQLAMSYAASKNLLLVNIKNATGVFKSNDTQYGDIALDAPTPNEFLSLIKYSNVVFTDSFHASVFSILFEKQFFGFSRCEFNSMESRMENLMQLFNLSERYLGQPEPLLLERMLKMSDIRYPLQYQKFNKEKTKSYNFLRRSMGGNE